MERRLVKIIANLQKHWKGNDATPFVPGIGSINNAYKAQNEEAFNAAGDRIKIYVSEGDIVSKSVPDPKVDLYNGRTKYIPINDANVQIGIQKEKANCKSSPKKKCGS